ncbi:unnamed protein product [Rotaria socialis]|uniref:Uncharacterized protein n=2 Tax=Rotaria socialis TaxID=392032 RepID=A0A818PET4_9BILA|nr:unnamed protein product [Rotaria socialis]CAF3493448.1 unnamed protein product [Rotaria socialis]CAF3532040.1 unnamed protein product [Rotaria socialis]CAF3622259.1 unnamed protein product [Rotaria socialis]CAF4458633.1 unnamed protein product [Rotaria socialis]
MLKQTTLDKLLRSAPLTTTVKNAQSEKKLNDGTCFSNNDDVNKTSLKEKEVIANENQAEIIIDLSDENETCTSSNIVVDHDYDHDYSIQTENEVTVTSTSPVTLPKKKIGRYLTTWGTTTRYIL